MAHTFVLSRAGEAFPKDMGALVRRTTCDELAPPCLDSGKAQSAVKRWYNAIMTRGPVTIANSAYTRERIMAEHHLPPERVIVIDRGVDLERFDPAKVTPGTTFEGRLELDIDLDVSRERRR